MKPDSLSALEALTGLLNEADRLASDSAKGFGRIGRDFGDDLDGIWISGDWEAGEQHRVRSVM